MPLFFDLAANYAECVFVSGRVHSAVVSGIDWEHRTVTVEWFERGETKGKEVFFLRKRHFATKPKVSEQHTSNISVRFLVSRWRWMRSSP